MLTLSTETATVDIADKIDFRRKYYEEIEVHFINLKVVPQKVEVTVVSHCVSANRTSKYMKQNLSKL